MHVFSFSVPPVVVAIVDEVIGNENDSVTLQFRIDNAIPVVELSELRWFYSSDISQSATMDDITNSTNRTMGSQLVTSFSDDGRFFNITVVNIQQQRQEGEETDQGRYFLQATNPAGSSMAYVDLEVYGKPTSVFPLLKLVTGATVFHRATTDYSTTRRSVCHCRRLCCVLLCCSSFPSTQHAVDIHRQQWRRNNHY